LRACSARQAGEHRPGRPSPASVNPAEGIWSTLKEIQYRPHLLDGCLGATGLENRAL
jgi:hypothetical protein